MTDLTKKTKAELIAIIEGDPTRRLGDEAIDRAAESAERLASNIAAMRQMHASLETILTELDGLVEQEGAGLDYFLRTFHEMRAERSGHQQQVKGLRALLAESKAETAREQVRSERITAAVDRVMGAAVARVAAILKDRRRTEATGKQIEAAIMAAIDETDWDEALADDD